jgi:hypothetical protein
MTEMQAKVAGSNVAGQVTPAESASAIYRIWRCELFSGIVLLLIWLAVSLPRLNGPIDLRWDASTYYVLGTALAQGKGYRLLNEPGEIKAVQYPPLLPAIIGVQERLMKTSDYFKVGWRLRVIYFLLSGAYLAAVYVLARQLLATFQALLVGAVTGLSFNSFFYPSETLYADLPFALCSIAFLLCQRKSDQPFFAAAQGIFGAAAYLLRTAGIVLLVVWVAESLVRRHWTQATIRAGIAVVPVLAWQMYVWQVTKSDEYHRPSYSYQRAPYYYSNVTYRENSSLIDPFRPELGHTKPSDLLGRVARNSMAIPLGLGESCWFSMPLLRYPLDKLHSRLPIPMPSGWQKLVSGALRICLVAVGVLSIVGAVLIGRGRDWFLSLYFVIGIAVVVLTPWQSQFWRYLAPLAPITLIFLAVALIAISGWLGQARFGQSRAVILLPVGFLSAMLLVQIVIAEPFLRNLLPVSYYDASGNERVGRLLTYEPHWHALDRAFEWVRQNAPPNAVIATTVPQLAFLRSSHKAVLPPLNPDAEQASQLLDEVPVSFLILDALGRPPVSDRYAAPIIAHKPGNWRLAYSAPDGGAKVYERIR